jgi:hypothetical protein
MRASFIMWNMQRRPVAGLADEVADRAGSAAHRVPAFAEVEQRVGNAAVSELVVQARQRHVVALAGEAAFGVDELLGHDEERDPLGARNRLAVGPGDLGQHQVDDVLGEFVLAVGDPHLVAAQAIARAQRIGVVAVAVGRGACRDIREARSGLGLRQAHRAEEAPGELVPREHGLLHRRAVRHQQVGVAAGQHAASADADGGLGEEAVRRHLHDAGQLHAAHLVVLRRGEHAGLDVGARRGVAAFGQVHLLAVEPRLLGVGDAVVRRELVAGNLLAGVEHRIEGLARVVGKARPLAQRLHAEPVVEQEVDGLAVGHRVSFPGEGCTLHSLRRFGCRVGISAGVGHPGGYGLRGLSHRLSFQTTEPQRSQSRKQGTPEFPLRALWLCGSDDGPRRHERASPRRAIVPCATAHCFSSPSRTA